MFVPIRQPTSSIAFGIAMVLASAPRTQQALECEVVNHHAAWCHQLYSDVTAKATRLQRAVDYLLDAPDERRLAAARRAWVEARKSYGLTEVLRFHDGPIEPLEPLLNAWPVDEAYIDYVRGRPDCGIVNSRDRYPALGAAILQLANERGGEANICVGWHAIEFMLWGQDLSAQGAGARPASDFFADNERNGARRSQYLRAITGLLVKHLTELRDEWRPDRNNYRRKFEADVTGALRRMLTGATVLTTFELGGERLTVAFDTRDQEQEHSCFSDTTCNDFIANQRGIHLLLHGAVVDGKHRPGLLQLLRDQHADVAAELEKRVATTTRAIASIPQPFDQALLGKDDEPGRKAIAAAIEALEQQSDALLIAGKRLGHDLPLSPGD